MDADKTSDDMKSYPIPPDAFDNAGFQISLESKYEALLLSLFWRDWCERYELTEFVDESCAEQARALPPNQVWTAFHDDEGIFVHPGFEEPDIHAWPSVKGYAITQKPWESPQEEGARKVSWALCNMCRGDQVVDDESCSSCDGRGGSWLELDFELPEPNYLDVFFAQGVSPTVLSELDSVLANDLMAVYLIPAKKIGAVRMWAAEISSRDAGYQSWNAQSNLAVAEFYEGNIEVAKEIFEEILAAGKGPVEEAEEFLDKISKAEG